MTSFIRVPEHPKHTPNNTLPQHEFDDCSSAQTHVQKHALMDISHELHQETLVHIRHRPLCKKWRVSDV
eukprot:6410561-Karenia_brevis.AAC.1